jgi:ABC-type dipeptide/oligopeptide/nickel transport system permease subunit
LGLGVEPSTPTWGSLAAQGRSYALEGAWHLGLFPGLIVVLLVATLHRLGRDAEQRVKA